MTIAASARSSTGVLRVISLIFTHGINTTAGVIHTRVDLQTAAIRLARLLADLLPAETEVRGLLALLLPTHALECPGNDAESEYISARVADLDR